MDLHATTPPRPQATDHRLERSRVMLSALVPSFCGEITSAGSISIKVERRPAKAKRLGRRHKLLAKRKCEIHLFGSDLKAGKARTIHLMDANPEDLKTMTAQKRLELVDRLELFRGDHNSR